MRARIHEEAGFTILEVLVAFMILATALVVASQTVARSVQSSVRAGERERVLSLITELRVDELPRLARQSKISGAGAGLDWTAEKIEAQDPIIASVAVKGAGPNPHAYRFLIAIPIALDGDTARDAE